MAIQCVCCMKMEAWKTTNGDDSNQEHSIPCDNDHDDHNNDHFQSDHDEYKSKWKHHIDIMDKDHNPNCKSQGEKRR